MESSSEALATTTTSAEIWKNLQDAFNAELADLEAQRKALRQEKEEFEEMKKKIQSVHFSSTVKLDVGGRQFKTSLVTLTKEDSMLSRMFSGNGFLVEKDEDGFYFIDRPGKPFATILNYLQTGVFIPPHDETSLAALKIEVDFYQIPGLVEHFNPRLDIKSQILTDEMKEKLIPMLDPKYLRWRLILDSTVDGKQTSTFDTAVKGKSRILVVIQNTAGYVFGAYVADTFGTTTGWTAGSRDTFLWTLRNNNTPVKLVYSGKGNSGHFQGCGLHLGNTMGELVAFCDHSVSSCAHPSVAYQLAPGYTATVDANLLAGGPSWTPQRMEVFEAVV